MCYAHFEGTCTDVKCTKSHATPTRAQLTIYKAYKAKREGKEKTEQETAMAAADVKTPAAKRKPSKKKQKTEAAAVALPVGSSSFVDLTDVDDYVTNE